jgi:hypothetical protein
MNDELANGLGIPKLWTKDAYPLGRDLQVTISVHILEYLSTPLAHPRPQESELPETRQPHIDMEEYCESRNMKDALSDAEPFEWVPPDLVPTGPWYRRVVLLLIYTCLLYPAPGPLIEEGILHLRAHRSNYNRSNPDPQRLQLLWWMFPPEHWDALREGSSMNFMHQPRCEITPNAPMEEEQIAIAEEFLDELVSLGTFIPVAPGEMSANGPLFCLPKPGQPGQWCILSDMKRGGQNAAIGPDPTVFPKSEHILNQMYTNGWSAVIDASKCFYQFKTHPKD